MSSTARGAKRITNDVYLTPQWCVSTLLEEISLPNGLYLEPSVGSGNILKPFRNTNISTNWHTIDIRSIDVSDLPEVSQHWTFDFLEWTPPPYRYDAAITNPPYLLATEFIEKCLTIADHTVMLLRLNFLASAKRADFMRNTTPDLYVLPNRPSFTGKGTDSPDYAWFHWHKHACGRYKILRSLTKQERQ